MSTTIINKNIGDLLCESNLGEEKYFTYDITTIPYWYPFNNNYELRFNRIKKEDNLYLTPIDKEITYTNYQVESEKDRAKSRVASFNPNKKWYSKEIFEGNKRIMNQAQSLGITTFYNDKFTHSDVQEGKQILADKEQEIKDQIKHRLMDFVDLENFHRLEWEQQDEVLYGYINEEEQEQLARLGSIHGMLNMMRKITEAKEIKAKT